MKVLRDQQQLFSLRRNFSVSIINNVMRTREKVLDCRRILAVLISGLFITALV
jgi:hypothetical protein